MKTRTTYHILAIAALLALWACSSDSDSWPKDSNECTPILFSSVSIDKNSVKTRTMAADTHNKGLDKGAEINVFIYNENGNPVKNGDEDSSPLATLPLVYKTTDDANPETAQSALTPKESNTSPAYPNGENNNAYIFAFYPTTATKVSDDEYTFSASTDQRVADNIIQSDLLATDLIIQPRAGGKAIDLPMSHRMAKIIVKFNPTGSLTEENMPTEFQVINVQKDITIRPKTTATSGSASITTSGAATTIIANSSEAFLIPPQTISNAFLKFTIKGKASDKFDDIIDVTFTPTQSLTLEANNVYEITVSVNVNYVTVTAAITPWNHEDITFDKYIL